MEELLVARDTPIVEKNSVNKETNTQVELLLIARHFFITSRHWLELYTRIVVISPNSYEQCIRRDLYEPLEGRCYYTSLWVERAQP